MATVSTTSTNHASMPPPRRQSTFRATGSKFDNLTVIGDDKSRTTCNNDTKHDIKGSPINGEENKASRLTNTVVETEPEPEEEEISISDCHKKIRTYFDKYWKQGEDITGFLAKLDTFHAKRSNIKRISDYIGKIDAEEHESPTILNLLLKAPLNDDKWDTRSELVKHVVKKHPYLLDAKDENQCVVLKSHLEKRWTKPNGFTHYFVKNFPEKVIQAISTWNDKLKESELEQKKDNLKLLLPHICFPELMGAGYLHYLLEHFDKVQLTTPFNVQEDIGRSTLFHLAVQYKYACDEEPNSQRTLLEKIKLVVEKFPEIISIKNEKKQSPYLHRIETHRKWKAKRGDGQGIYNDIITDFLKDKVISGNFDDTGELLYTQDEDRPEMSLNLIDLPRGENDTCQIDQEKLDYFLNRFKFEPTLKYVRIPHLQLDKKLEKRSTTSQKAAKRPAVVNVGTGRSDYVTILKDLRYKGKVRRIIELSVDDEEHPAHTDHEIRSLGALEQPREDGVNKDSCDLQLRHFGIEIFDWRKLDICTETILAVAPDARVIKLHCSGNNAVLRSWSAADGLGKFDKLKEVHVFIRLGIEEVETMQRNCAEFESRMRLNCPKIKLNITPENLQDGESKARGNSKTATANLNEWMAHIDKFAKFIQNIPSAVDGRRRIKVALIDDGVNALDGINQFKDSIISGKSFWDSNNHRPYWLSSQGHGTLMAELIQYVCPHVQLCVARLAEVQSAQSNRGKPTAESAAKAVEWAIQQKVDIISMSWTFNEEGHVNILRPAIALAEQENILMFGAASDQGHNRSNKSFPGGHKSVFCIGAADGTGASDGAAAGEADFFLPGSYTNTDRALEGSMTENMKGSSFATAVAAGLAALILDCVALALPEKAEETIKIIRTHESMGEIFKEMSREKNKFISVVEYFPQKASQWKWGNEEEGPKLFEAAINRIIIPGLPHVS